MANVLFFIKFLPPMLVNRNNSEQQIFTKYFDIVDRNRIKQFIDDKVEIVKNASLSKIYRNIGIKCCTEKDYVQALTTFTDSIVQEPQGNVDFGLSIAHRSAVLFNMQRYKECLVDIDRVFKSEYPKDMLYTIFVRQAKCYAALKHHRQASEAIQSAKSHFETAKIAMNRMDIDTVVDEISAVEKSLENLCAGEQSVEEQSSLPALTDGENPQFAYASKTVAMQQNKRRGRHVVANADIKAGDVLFVEEPYSTSAFKVDNESFIYCSHCLTSTLTCIPCTSCTDVVFCSGQCREQYWNSSHRWLCAGHRRSVITQEFNLALGVLFRASHTGFQTAISDKQVFGNKSDNYPYVNLLMTHKHNIRPDTYSDYVKVATFLVIYLIHFTDYFDWLYSQEDRPAGAREHLYGIVGGTLLTILCQNSCNAETVSDNFVVLNDKFNIELKSNKLSSALYVSSALMNHSCLPNAVCSYHGNVKIVRALTDIGKGTEVTVSYLGRFNIVDVNTRRTALQREFYFLCTCRGCNEHISFMPWLCVRCRGRALTTADERTAKCLDCQHEFPLNAYARMEMEAIFLSDLALMTDNISLLNKSAATFKRIYHSTNWKLTISYTTFYKYHRALGDFKNCLEYVELLMNLVKVMYGSNANDSSVIMSLKHCLILMNYCLSLRYQKPVLYRKYLKRTKEAINNNTQLLKYHMRKEVADIYQRDMLRILNAGDANFDATPILFHHNATPSE